MRTLVVFALSLTLAACASTGAEPGLYAADMERLRSECQARGGVLAPSGATTSRPALDDLCHIPGGASAIPR